jgi:low affinity Fe/Cu permease
MPVRSARVRSDQSGKGQTPRQSRFALVSPSSGDIVQDFFRAFAQRAAQVLGSPWAFIAAILSIIVWAVTGPLFGFSDTWQLVINTATTIITFLMVFVIQNTQNRDTKALHLKLDELLRAVQGARTHLVSLETWSDEELTQLQQQFERLQRAHQQAHTDSHPGGGLSTG